MPTFVSVSEEILDDRNGCNTQKNPLEINKMNQSNIFFSKHKIKANVTFFKTSG